MAFVTDLSKVEPFAGEREDGFVPRGVGGRELEVEGEGRKVEHFDQPRKSGRSGMFG